jgi:hypothetical protein
LKEVRKDVGVQIFRGDSKVPIEKEQELFLHQIDFGKGEKSHRISSPMLVFRGRIVEILGRQDECREEDSVAGALHALGDFGKTRF